MVLTGAAQVVLNVLHKKSLMVSHLIGGASLPWDMEKLQCVCVCAACATVATSLGWGSVLVSRGHSNSQLSTVTPGSGWVSSCLSTLPLGPGSARWPCNPLLRVKIHSNFPAFKNAVFLWPVLLSAEWRKKVLRLPSNFTQLLSLNICQRCFFCVSEGLPAPAGTQTNWNDSVCC